MIEPARRMVVPAAFMRSGTAPRDGRSRPDQRIRVVQVTAALSVGGLERMIVTLSKALDPREFDVHVVCLSGRGDLAQDLDAAGIPVHTLGTAAGRVDYLATFRVTRLLRRLRPDVVHTHNTQALLEGGLGAVLARVPTLVHTDHARLYPDKLRYVVAEHLVAKAAYRVVGVSDHTTADLARHVRIPRSKLLTVPNGIDPAPMRSPVDRAAKLAELGVHHDGPVIGTVARLAPQKGHTHLLDAMPALVAREPRLTLLLVGDGELRSTLEARVAALGLERNVRFLGTRLDSTRLYRLFDIFVLPSLWEGLPLTILEAMAAGLPVVATDVGGVATAVQRDVTGLLVPSGQPALLATAMEALLSDARLRNRLGRAGLERFRQHFSDDVMAARYGALYHAGCAERGGFARGGGHAATAGGTDVR